MDEYFFKVTDDRLRSKFAEAFGERIALDYHNMGQVVTPKVGYIFAYEFAHKRMSEFTYNTRLLVVKGVRVPPPEKLFISHRGEDFFRVLDYMRVANYDLLTKFWNMEDLGPDDSWSNHCDEKMFYDWNTVFLSECTPVKEITDSYREYWGEMRSKYAPDRLFDWETETWEKPIPAEPDEQE